MTIAEFSITPIGKGVSVGEYVARSVDIVDRSGLPYRLNPMGTVIEGSFDEILALIARCHKPSWRTANASRRSSRSTTAKARRSNSRRKPWEWSGGSAERLGLSRRFLQG